MKTLKTVIMCATVSIFLTNCQSAEDKKFLEELEQCRAQQQEYDYYKKYNRLDEYNQLH